MAGGDLRFGCAPYGLMVPTLLYHPQDMESGMLGFIGGYWSILTVEKGDYSEYASVAAIFGA